MNYKVFVSGRYFSSLSTGPCCALALTLILLCTTARPSIAQPSTLSQLSMSEAFQRIFLSGDTLIDLTGYLVTGQIDNSVLNKMIGSNMSNLKLNDSRLVIDKEIWFGPVNGTFTNLDFRKVVKVGMHLDQMTNTFDSYVQGTVKFTNCIFEDDVTVDGHEANFDNVQLNANLYCTTEQLIARNIHSYDALQYAPDEQGSATFFESVFTDTLLIIGRMGTLEIFNNEFKADLDLSQAEVLDKLYLQRNKVAGKIVFGELKLPDNTIIHWDFKPRQLAYALPEKNDTSMWNAKYGKHNRAYISADYTDIFESKFLFLGLNALHKKLYDYFLARGDIESANACYIEMKDIETNYYRQAFLQYGGFRNFLRWNLNWIIKMYTAYGTDPSLALLVSTYVIFLFAVIFFFYPAEWDTESHPELLGHWAILTSPGAVTFRNTISALWSVIIALLIALTLSLNSFITIGFGNIPTRGVARFACIIEGTLGWFLLTLFSVALISQLVY